MLQCCGREISEETEEIEARTCSLEGGGSRGRHVRVVQLEHVPHSKLRNPIVYESRCPYVGEVLPVNQKTFATSRWPWVCARTWSAGVSWILVLSQHLDKVSSPSSQDHHLMKFMNHLTSSYLISEHTHDLSLAIDHLDHILMLGYVGGHASLGELQVAPSLL